MTTLDSLREERKDLVKASRAANDEIEQARDLAFRKDRGFGSAVRGAQQKADAAYAACVEFDRAHPEVKAAIDQEKADKLAKVNVWNL